MGKLLISARVEKLADIEDLCSAGSVPAARFDEPASVRICLLTDVYMVAGAVGRECMVEITLGKNHVSTDWVYPVMDPTDAQAKAMSQSSSSSSSASGEYAQEFDMPTTFQYDQRQGRPDVISLLAPEDPISQPDCLVNVYTRGVMSGKVRLGYCRLKLNEIHPYDPGNPRIPTFFPLIPMPWNGVQTLPASLLMTLEKTSDEASTNSSNRHNRKQVKNMLYVLRAYVFAAKDVQGFDISRPGGYSGEPNLFVRVTCAGASVETARLQGDLRPSWMKCLELNITLMSDHPKKAPTMEPITVSLLNQDNFISSSTLGKAICRYTYMRTRNLLNEWEPFSIEPQWVKLRGGQYNSKTLGSVCVAFELLRKKDIQQLPPQSMWPMQEPAYRPAIDFCRMRKATMHISLLGLRDMKPVSSLGGLMSSNVANPVVEFRIRKLLKHHGAHASSGEGLKGLATNTEVNGSSSTNYSTFNIAHEYWRCKFQYQQVKDEGDPNTPEDRNKNWESGSGMSFEFLQYGRINVMLPELPIFQPWVACLVYNNGSTKQPIADCRLPIGPKLPWLTHPGEYQVAEVRDEYTEENDEDRQVKVEHIREASLAQGGDGKSIKGNNKGKGTGLLIGAPQATEQELDTTAVHILLKQGRKGKQSLEMFPHSENDLNMKLGHSHGRLLKSQTITGAEKNKLAAQFGTNTLLSSSKPPLQTVNEDDTLDDDDAADAGGGGGASPNNAGGTGGRATTEKFKDVDPNQYYLQAIGEIPRGGFDGGSATRQEVEGRLEDNPDKSKFGNDLYYRNIPLTRNRDSAQTSDMEPAFDVGVYGYVKCFIKLTEGHMSEINGGVSDNYMGMSTSSSDSAYKIEKAQADQKKFAEDFENQDIKDNDALEGSSSSSTSASGGGGVDLDSADGSGNPQDSSGSGNSSSSGTVAVSGSGRRSSTSSSIDSGGKNIDPVSGRQQSMDTPEVLEKYAWSDEGLREKYKNTDNLPTRVRVRLYFVKGICIYGKGSSGFASPYLEFNLGKAVLVSMRNLYQSNTNTPSFYRLEERDIRMPEDARCEISLKDYGGGLGGDGVIGSTVIDLEDRWHSENWQNLADKQLVPVENRGLWSSSAHGMSRGSLEMWVEMLDSVKSSDQKASALRAPPVQEIEVRFVIWDTVGVRIVDGEHTDVTLSVNLDCAEYKGGLAIQNTDVHYGSKDGNAVFNWRVVYSKIRMPTKSATLQISVSDYNAFSGNTYIGDVNLDLKKYLEKVARDMDAIQLTSTLRCKNGPYQEENPEVEHVGEVNISMWVLTQSEADAQPVGLARNEPNVNPQLITPLEGRGWGDVLGSFTFTLPDFGLLGKVFPIIILVFLMLIGLKYIGLL